MKSFTLCLLLILSLLIHQGLGASVRGNEIMDSADRLAMHQTEEPGVLAPYIRRRRHTVLSICSYCCNCCKNKQCGYCCRT
ncbi:hepcidin [Phyllobates terribilis]|uniref:hepcidin n=1 Tax=Phyllobates terribilis TaxID=111132 RepID=UPI003CCB6EC5